jgi:predicted RNase H-like nuclease
MAPADDVLDAAAAAWTARRKAVGEARSLPDPPELIRGRPVAIWY